MTAYPLASRAYSRPSMGMPEARLQNMFVEGTPHGPNADARFPRPALVSFYTNGTGPIRGAFTAPGVFGGELFVVSGTAATLQSTGGGVGTIAGTDMVRWSNSATQLVAVASDLAYLYEGSAFAQITDPDMPAVSDTAYLGGRFVYTVEGSDRFYWSEVNDAGNIDGLSFSTAESLADPNVGVATLSNELFFFGQNSVEPWYVTGDNDQPFAPTQGRNVDYGCASRNTIVEVDNDLYFVSSDGVVRTVSGKRGRVSDHGIEDRLRRCTSLSAATAIGAVIDGHSFYVLNIPGMGSFALDVENTQLGWAEWTSFGRSVFKGQCSATKNRVVYIGDDTYGTVHALTPGVYTEAGATSEPMTFLASAFVPHTGKPMRCDNVVLQGARGQSLVTGQGSDAQVEMRYSDDGGKTWSRWRSASVGLIGEYARRPVWQRLGLIREPGRAFEFRMTDPVLASMSGMLMNEDRPHG